MTSIARILTVLLLLTTLGLAACKEDPMRRGRTAHAAELADEAESAFKEVLATDPKNFEARRLMADVHKFRGDFEKSEKALEELWKEKNFGDEAAKRSDDERAARDKMETQFTELYSKWTASLDPQKNAELFERVAKRGLEFDKTSTMLNTQLVDFYFARGDKFSEDGKREEAAKAYDAVYMLRTTAKRRKDAATRAEALRRELFKETASKRWEGELKPRFTTENRWNPDEEMLLIPVEAEVDKGLNPRKDEDMVAARDASRATVRVKIAETVSEITGLDPALAGQVAFKTKSIDESLKRGTYSVTVTAAVDDIIDAAFAVHEKDRKDKAEAASAGAAKEEAPAPDENEADGTAAPADGAESDGGEKTP